MSWYRIASFGLGSIAGALCGRGFEDGFNRYLGGAIAVIALVIAGCIYMEVRSARSHKR